LALPPLDTGRRRRTSHIIQYRRQIVASRERARQLAEAAQRRAAAAEARGVNLITKPALLALYLVHVKRVDFWLSTFHILSSDAELN
jgi:hypothetical protein